MKLPAYEVIPLASWFCVNEWQDIWCCFSTVFSEHIVFYRQHCAQRKPAGIKFTQRPILRFFAPQGRHVASIGVKFGMEEGTKGPLLIRSPPPCQISPPPVQREGCRTPKIEIFTQI